MPKTLESPDSQVESPPQVTPPIEATFNVETTKGLTPVRDAVSKAVVSKSNYRVSELLKDSLRAALKVSKTLFGSVGKFATAFTGIRNLVRGI